MFTAPPPPTLTISPSVGGTSTAGDSFSLTCTVSVVENLIQSPIVTWIGPGVGQTGVKEIGLMVSDAVTILTLSFNPLQTSHGGQYTCRAVLSNNIISNAGVNTSTMSSTDVQVQG